MSEETNNAFARIVLAPAIGLPAIVWFGYLTDVWTAIALFLALLANNFSQMRP